MKRTAIALAIGSISTFLVFSATAEQPSTTTQAKTAKDHIMLRPSELKWGEAPAGLPSGAKATVLEGDPKKEGAFTLRLEFPAGYRVMPHWHPADEHVTVIEGSFQMGLGDRMNEKSMTDLERGSFAVMKAGTHHYAMSKTGATIQLHGMGPWAITYVDPADDPRKQRVSR